MIFCAGCSTVAEPFFQVTPLALAFIRFILLRAVITFTFTSSHPHWPWKLLEQTITDIRVLLAQAF